ncbi:hypothetical protein [Streptomyces sp. NPDC059371]|uniref:hypothetical protein n=1 Tax=Streptomyces sp. NPDC059371 TaxID=3346812 RepID=UPI0036CB53B6
MRDSARAQPIVREVDPLRGGQHGLEIVRAVTRKIQVQVEPSGKRVTARIALGDESGSGQA